jgi:predicted SnoaL-like aldol condensation-catalyzing enzyme
MDAAAVPTPEERARLTPREVAERFIPLFYEQRNARLAFETWMSPDYIQHNPMARDGREAAIEVIEPAFDAQPDMRYDIKLVIADGPYVMIHNWMQRWPGDRGAAVVDILRIEKGWIVEHWDVLQWIPEVSANDHPMF